MGLLESCKAEFWANLLFPDLSPPVINVIIAIFLQKSTGKNWIEKDKRRFKSFYSAFFPESVNSLIVAGFLTYSSLNAFPSLLRASDIVFKVLIELTAAGTVQAFHLIPFQLF